MKAVIKNTWILFVITLIAGLLLGLVYEITAEPRAYQEEKAKQEAYMAVFAEADSFEEITDYDADAMEAYLEAVGVSSDTAGIVEVALAYSASGEMLGYVFTVDSYKGYGGTIEFSVGIASAPEGAIVNGYSILSISETAGLGMKAKESAFSGQFEGKSAEPLKYTKSGAAAENEIDAISGATYTTRAMTDGVNACIYAYEFMELR